MIKDWTGFVQDEPLRIFEDAREWMGSKIVPIYFPVSSNIQFPVFYHFPLSTTFLFCISPRNGCFSSFFHHFFIYWKWKKYREKDELNNLWNISERERKSKEHRRKELRKYEISEGKIWDQLTLPNASKYSWKFKEEIPEKPGKKPVIRKLKTPTWNELYDRFFLPKYRFQR